MTDNERVAKGHRAFNELQEVGEAFDKVKSAIVQELVSTSPVQQDKILTLHRAAQIVEAVKTAMTRVVDDGRLAEHAISEAGLTRNSF